jgi:selenide,water dikinase
LAIARAGVQTDGALHNRRSFREQLTIEPGVPPGLEALAFDPQTSGGLLAAVPVVGSADVGTALAAAGVPHAWIGEVEEGSGVVLR